MRGQKFVADALEHYRMEAVTLTGERVGLMTEVITCMKLIKMNAWEPSFMARISSRCLPLLALSLSLCQCVCACVCVCVCVYVCVCVCVCVRSVEACYVRYYGQAKNYYTQ